jgi:murein DD-endopeptidase MepM/ murein hydrolase activator NlpD
VTPHSKTEYNKKQQLSAHWRWFAVALFTPLSLGALTYWLTEQVPTRFGGALHVSEVPLQSLALPMSSIDVVEPVLDPIGDAVEFIVRRNDTLERIFREARINLDDLATIRTLPGVRESIDALRPGDHIAMTHVDGALQSFARRISESALLSVERDNEGFIAKIIETPIDVQATHAHGVIESSLFVNGREAGLSSDLIMRLANDIFGWDIDFALDIRRGDSFSVVYEKKYRDGEYLGDGRILAAEFSNDGRVFRAVRFESTDGKHSGYFAPDGKSMRKQFLRAPVDFKYISSNFNPSRLHPVLNIRRAHQGVDYAAPSGTPIKASGDGRVSFVGTKGGYGKAVILEHGGAVSTLYGHMSRFARDIRVGSRVKQGEIIGYVGSTGTATAAHLHYEYRINGIHKNPRTVSLPDASPIPSQYLAEFLSTTSALLARLDQSRAEQLALVPTRQ